MPQLSEAEYRTARDHLIDEGMRLGVDSIQAADLLTTAGFSLLAVTVGLDNARGLMPSIVEGFLGDLPKVN
jgi:hypothetical protein